MVAAVLDRSLVLRWGNITHKLTVTPEANPSWQEMLQFVANSINELSRKQADQNRKP